MYKYNFTLFYPFPEDNSDSRQEHILIRIYTNLCYFEKNHNIDLYKQHKTQKYLIPNL